MIRKIVQIEEDRCTGCGLCAHACHESAIAMVDGKAKLIRDDYCDGFGDCLPVCPADAISFVEREALPYDEEAVKENQRKAKEAAGQENTGAGKAGENSWAIDRADAQKNSAAVPSRLRQWPVQIRLAPPTAAFYQGADLLIVDTAGRLHNKKNLMDELNKMRRVIDREFPEADVRCMLVLDATTGQNGLAQARAFKEVCEIGGIILTKLDGTAKGGIALAIRQELEVPVWYIGVGEGIDDLQPFNAKDFVEALF